MLTREQLIQLYKLKLQKDEQLNQNKKEQEQKKKDQEQKKKEQEIKSENERIKKEHEAKIKEEHLKYFNNDKIVKQEQYKYINHLLNMSYVKRLYVLSRGITIKEFTSEHNHSKHVHLMQGYVVRKTIEPTSFGNFVFWNEVNALKKLLKYPHFPKLLAYDSYNLVIYMTYCGNVVNSENLPVDWMEQVNVIKTILKSVDVNSNDMLLRNTCVLDSKIYIIDFGLTSQFVKSIDISVNKLAAEMLAIDKYKKLQKTVRK